MMEMDGCLIVNGFLHSKKFDELNELFCSAAEKEEIHLEVLENKEIPAELKFCGTDFYKLGKAPDFVLFWDKDILLAEYLEIGGLPVYNSSKAIALCDDKRKTHLALKKAGVPMPDTILAPMTYGSIGFSDMDFLDRVEKALGYPMIVKEAYGSFGAQVYLAADRKELERIINECSTTEILFQKYISYSKGRDIRLQVVGNEVIGAMYRYSDKDFRANVSAGGQMKEYQPSKEECELALMAARAVDVDFAGVDLLFSPDGPIVCEVNSNAHFKNLLDCSGVNTADAIMKYIKKDLGYV
jgi:RimK family alpha-L-glutamate ligase